MVNMINGLRSFSMDVPVCPVSKETCDKLSTNYGNESEVIEDKPDLSSDKPCSSSKPTDSLVKFLNLQEKKRKFDKFRKKRLSNINEGRTECEAIIQLDSSPYGHELINVRDMVNLR
uniref:Uncharacterized protein n=1 Tax=Acrobeloides nanus TaxID=290746 RepID=A0A914D426_9BILA